MEEIESIQDFLENPDIEYVAQGLDLWQILTEDCSAFLLQLTQVLKCETDPIVSVEQLRSFEDLQDLFAAFPQKNYIAFWCLGLLASFEEYQEYNQQCTELDLSQMKLERIPDTVNHLVHLRSLDLSLNGISDIPLVDALLNLEWLNLSSNKLEDFDLDLCQLRSIEWLDIHDNPMEEIPTEIQNLTRLSYLNYQETQITRIPFLLAQKEKQGKLRIDRPSSPRRFV